jgi:NAD(P)-dependent dehydrogenase (short-subunit alcohol dehydrogenase family)
MTRDLEGKVILITGATDGIGKAAATEVAKRGATLTIVGRNKQKTEHVLTELNGASGNSNISHRTKKTAEIENLDFREKLIARGAQRRGSVGASTRRLSNLFCTRAHTRRGTVPCL